MPEIVITEFMDEAAIHASFAGRDVLYDPKLVDDPHGSLAAVRDARALIVRNRTQVRGALLEAAARLEVVGRLGVGLDNIDVRGLRGARHRRVPGHRRQRPVGRRIRHHRGADAAAAGVVRHGASGRRRVAAHRAAWAANSRASGSASSATAPSRA